jgi:hypothetical protein
LVGGVVAADVAEQITECSAAGIVEIGRDGHFGDDVLGLPCEFEVRFGANNVVELLFGHVADGIRRLLSFRSLRTD